MIRRTWIFVLLLVSLSLISAAEGLTVSAPDQVLLGDPFPVTVSGDENLNSVRLVWGGRCLPMERRICHGKRSFFTTLVCPALDERVGKHVIIFEVLRGEKAYRLPWQVLVKGRNFARTNLTVVPEKAVPPRRMLERIARERRQAERVLAEETFPCRWELPLVRPVEGVVTSPYGTERIFNGTTRSRHSGVDFRAAKGTPVHVVAGGRVALTGDRYFSGKSVFVDHGGGWISLYGHLDRIRVSDGEVLHAGDVVGLSGATGRVTGPHLHFGLAIHGQMADVMSLFGESRQSFHQNCREVAILLD